VAVLPPDDTTRRGTQCGNRVRQLASDGQRDRPVKRKRLGGGRHWPSGYVGCTGGAEARTEIIPEGNAEFLACFEQAEKAIAAITPDITASAATDLPLRDLTVDVVFRPLCRALNYADQIRDGATLSRCRPFAKSTTAVLRSWLNEPQRGEESVLFPSARGERLSVHGVQYILNKHR
jgi:hypothetical protein